LQRASCCFDNNYFNYLQVPLPASNNAHLFQASSHAANSDGLIW